MVALVKPSLKQEVRMTLLGLAILLLWGEVKHVEAGCQRFGHSCFGAHGKRAEVPTALELPESLGYPNALSPVPADFNNRVSPYLFDWLMAMHRAQQMQQQGASLGRTGPGLDDLGMVERRRK